MHDWNNKLGEWIAYACERDFEKCASRRSTAHSYRILHRARLRVPLPTSLHDEQAVRHGCRARYFDDRFPRRTGAVVSATAEVSEQRRDRNACVARVAVRKDKLCSLVIYGDSDDIVPTAHSQELLACLPGPHVDLVSDVIKSAR